MRTRPVRQSAQQQFPSSFGNPYTYISPQQQFHPPAQWQLATITAQQPSSAPSLPAATLMAITSALPNLNWHTDTGASLHITNNPHNSELHLEVPTRSSLAMGKVAFILGRKSNLENHLQACQSSKISQFH